MNQQFDEAYPTMGYNPGVTLPVDGLYRVNLSVFNHVSDMGHRMEAKEGIFDNLEGKYCHGIFPSNPTPDYYEKPDPQNIGYTIVRLYRTELETGGLLISGDIRLTDTSMGDRMKALLESDQDVYFGAAGAGNVLPPDDTRPIPTRIHNVMWSFDISPIPRLKPEAYE